MYVRRVALPADRSRASADEVRSQRARIARLVVAGKRFGYGLYLLAIVLFVVGYVAGYTPTITSVIAVCLVVGSIVLAPAIVFGYGVKSAERAERGESRRH